MTMTTCLKCRQPFSEENHKCLAEMTIDEIFDESLVEVRESMREYNPMKATLTFTFNGETIEGVAFVADVPTGQAPDDEDFKP